MFATSANAQNIPVNSSNLSGTIAATNTFQVIQASNGGRIGCTIQNNGSHNEYVYFDKSSVTCANATTLTSFVLSPSQPINCAISSNFVLKDTVCITGTSSDAFTANFQ